MEYKDESDTLLLSRSLQSREGVELGSLELGHAGAGRLQQENIIMMAILEHCCVPVCVLIIVLTLLKCDLLFHR